jgi:hypothetical protein
VFAIFSFLRVLTRQGHCSRFLQEVAGGAERDLTSCKSAVHGVGSLLVCLPATQEGCCATAELVDSIFDRLSGTLGRVSAHIINGKFHSLTDNRPSVHVRHQIADLELSLGLCWKVDLKWSKMSDGWRHDAGVSPPWKKDNVRGTKHGLFYAFFFASFASRSEAGFYFQLPVKTSDPAPGSESRNIDSGDACCAVYFKGRGQFARRRHHHR